MEFMASDSPAELDLSIHPVSTHAYLRPSWRACLHVARTFVVAGGMLVGQSGPFVGPFLESCLLCAPRVRQNGILRDVCTREGLDLEGMDVDEAHRWKKP